MGIDSVGGADPVACRATGLPYKANESKNWRRISLDRSSEGKVRQVSPAVSAKLISTAFFDSQWEYRTWLRMAPKIGILAVGGGYIACLFI